MWNVTFQEKQKLYYHYFQFGMYWFAYVFFSIFLSGFQRIRIWRIFCLDLIFSAMWINAQNVGKRMITTTEKNILLSYFSMWSVWDLLKQRSTLTGVMFYVNFCMLHMRISESAWGGSEKFWHEVWHLWFYLKKKAI